MKSHYVLFSSPHPFAYTKRNSTFVYNIIINLQMVFHSTLYSSMYTRWCCMLLCFFWICVYDVVASASCWCDCISIIYFVIIVFHFSLRVNKFSDFLIAHLHCTSLFLFNSALFKSLKTLPNTFTFFVVIIISHYILSCCSIQYFLLGFFKRIAALLLLFKFSDVGINVLFIDVHLKSGSRFLFVVFLVIDFCFAVVELMLNSCVRPSCIYFLVSIG